MPFEDDHLVESRTDDNKRYAIADPEWDDLGSETVSAKTTKLGVPIQRGLTDLAYTDDFGGDGRFAVTLDAAAGADMAIEYPRVLDSQGLARPRTSEAGLASRCAVRRSPIRTTKGTKTCRDGTAAPSIPAISAATRS